MKNNDNKKLLLIDGNSVLFRAFYATAYGNIMKTSFGAYTNAIYAFANMLNKALKLIEPKYCVVAFDKGKHTFRHDLNPDYKGGRKETPQELIEQFALVRDMLKAYNIPYLEYENIEADDIIGTLAKKYEIETCIFSSDHDLLQLIDDTTSMYVMKKGMSDLIRMNITELYEEYGLKPYQIIDFKGLAGDKSDNIKGVDGVGEKTAVKLLQDYDTCEGIYDHIEEIKGKLKEKLISDKESCFLSKKLATIKTDVEIDKDISEFELNINTQARNDFFLKYEMKSLIPKDEYKPAPKLDYRKVSKVSNSILDNAFIFFVSDEFSYYERNIYGVCIKNSSGEEYIDIIDALKDQDLIEYIASNKHKVLYDLKATKHQLDNYKLKVGENSDDLMIMAFLSNNYNTDIGSIFHNYGYYQSYELKDIFGTVKKPLEIDDVKVMSYAFELTNNLYEIYSKVKNELKEKDMLDLYNNVELPLANVLYNMENEGIICDENELNSIAKTTKDKCDYLEKDVYAVVGHEFNINSPSQLSDVLYNELNLPDFKKGSTNAEVLQKLVDYSPVIEKILEYRKYSKLYSTYAEGLKKYIGKDKKIHTIFSQTITNTGRLSSSEPNLQNISVRDEEGKEIRKAFKPKENNYIISCDYSQIELRVLASLANEEKMLDAFNNDIDIHEKTAMDVFGITKDEVNSLMRRRAKAINFGVVYGISDFGLANQTNLSFKEAKTFIDNYFKTYPSIKEYLDKQVEFCKENGYVKTILNRRRYINEINDSKWQMREFGKRAAMNATIQGSAADIIKIAMVNIDKEIKNRNLKSRLILQIHDELIFDVYEDELEIMKSIIKDIMANVYKMPCRLDSSLSVGKDFYEAK